MRNLVLSLSLLFTLLFESRANTMTIHNDRSASSEGELPAKAAFSVGSQLTVILSTATNKTIQFKREDLEEAKAQSSDEIPHLILNRNGVPTPGSERTLIVSLENLIVPPSGAYVQLSIETQHADPDLGRRSNHRIRVWRDSTFVPYDARNQKPAQVQFRIIFAPTTKLADKTIRTPTDYFRYRIVIFDPKGNRLKRYSGDYAFLMENQWRAPLPRVLEQTPGAAPAELLIYYYDMVPFQTDMRDPDTQIPRQEVSTYIQAELMPQMVQAFEMQTDLWDLPWYEEWSSYRTDEDPKILSVALGGYQTWFHGSAPSLGHAMISIRVDGSFGEYSNMTEGIMSVFHHELFHNQQRNIRLHFGNNGSISGQEEAWKLFSEGTAVLASLVAQPEVQLEATRHLRSYVKRANSFIGLEGAAGGGLNEKYKDIPYHTALYWRFLYENCGGISWRGEDPATGMKVIRHTLETLYKGEVVQIDSSTDIAAAFPRIIDRALEATPSCAFHTYEESLIHFARAIYMLRLENGRCSNFISHSTCGFVDPRHLYQRPPAEVFLITANEKINVGGSIPSSYGIDLVELQLAPSLQGKNLKLVFTSQDNPDIEFHVELCKTKMVSGSESEHQVGRGIEPSSMVSEDGTVILDIEKINRNEFDGLGLIVTRMDPYEEQSTVGTYSIQLIAE